MSRHLAAAMTPDRSAWATIASVSAFHSGSGVSRNSQCTMRTRSAGTIRNRSRSMPRISARAAASALMVPPMFFSARAAGCTIETFVSEAWSLDFTRTEAGDVDAARLELVAQALCEADHCELRSPVGGVAIDRHVSAHRADEHDLAAPFAQHRRQNGFDQVPAAVEIDAHHAVEFLELHLGELARAADAGAVDQDIGRAELRLRPRDGGGDGGAIGDIHAKVRDALIGGGTRRGHFSERIGIGRAAQQQHMRAACGQCPCCRQTDAASPAGDVNGLAGDGRHGVQAAIRGARPIVRSDLHPRPAASTARAAPCAARCRESCAGARRCREGGVESESSRPARSPGPPAADGLRPDGRRRASLASRGSDSHGADSRRAPPPAPCPEGLSSVRTAP